MALVAGFIITPLVADNQMWVAVKKGSIVDQFHKMLFALLLKAY